MITNSRNTVAMRELSSMFPSASLSFDAPAELNVRSVLSTVTELRLVVSEHQSLVQTLTHLPQLKLLELDDERRCTCIVRLPLMPDLISLTLAIHSCALDRYGFSIWKISLNSSVDSVKANNKSQYMTQSFWIAFKWSVRLCLKSSLKAGKTAAFAIRWEYFVHQS